MRSPAATLAALLLAGPAAAFDFQIEHVTGGEPPGLPAAEFERFSIPVINESGQIAFGAALEIGVGGATFDNSRVVFGPKGGGALELIARGDDAAPGVPGQVFSRSRMSDIQLNDAGEVMFDASAGGKIGLWRWSLASNALAYVARQDDPVPGAPAGITFRHSFPQMALTDAGVFACQLTYIGGEYHLGPLGDSVTTFLEQGDPLPGTPTETVYEPCEGTTASVSYSGEMAIKVGTNFVAGADAIFVVDSSETYTQIAIEGSLPGDPVGYTLLHNTAMNRLGQVAFFAGQPGWGLWGPDTFGSLSLLAQSSTAVPGHPGLFFAYAGNNDLILTDSGYIFFESFVSPSSGADDQAVFRRDLSGAIELIYREGDTAPDGNPYLSPQLPPANDEGNALLRTSSTIYVSRLGGALEKIIGVGDTLEVAPGDSRTINSLDYHDWPRDQVWNRRSLNDDGEFVFAAYFSDITWAVVRVDISEQTESVPALPMLGWFVVVAALTALGALGARRTPR